MNMTMPRLKLDKPSRWLGADAAATTSDNGIRYVFPFAGGEVNGLPSEFAFREFLEFDPTDEDALIGFMHKWGALWHPYRFSLAYHSYYDDTERIEAELKRARGEYRKSYLGELEVEQKANVPFVFPAAPEELGQFEGNWGRLQYERKVRALHAQHVHHALKESDGILFGRNFNDPSDLENAYPAEGLLSLEEATLAAIDLQICIRAILAYDTYENDADPTLALELINEGAKHETQLVLDIPTSCGSKQAGRSMPSGFKGLFFARTSLTNEICNQVVSVFGSDTEWKQCECEGCGHWFKTKRDGAKTGGKKGSRDPIYCSKQCNDRAAKRKQREREKAAKQAGEKRRA